MLESLNLFDILGCACVVILFLLCLPSVRITKWVLEVSTWSMRMTVLGVLAMGFFFWISPANVPDEVNAIIQALPSEVQEFLPDPNLPVSSLVFACAFSLLCLPFLAVLEVSRRLAGSRMVQLCQLTGDSGMTGNLRSQQKETRYHSRHDTPGPKGFKIQDSANAMAGALATQRKPPRVSDYLN